MNWIELNITEISAVLVLYVRFYDRACALRRTAGIFNENMPYWHKEL